MQAGFRPTKRINVIASPLVGVIFAWLLNAPYWIFPIAAIHWWLAEKPGHGWPKGYIVRGFRPDIDKPGAMPERWQPEWSIDRPFLAMAIRGFIWFAPFTAMMFSDEEPDEFHEWLYTVVGGTTTGVLIFCMPDFVWFFAGYIIGLPLVMLIGLILQKAKLEIPQATNAWQISEWLLQPVVAIIVFSGILANTT